MSYENCQEVINDFENLLETGEGHDVIIYAGQYEKVKAIRAHLIILNTRSQYFRTELSKENIEKKDGKYILRNPDISHRFFLLILRYIYCGKIDLSKLQSLDTLTLLNNVEVFNIKSLTTCIRDHLAKNQYEFLQQNEKLFETGEEHDVIIYAGQNNNLIRAHSNILRNRSQYFCAELSKEIVEKKDGRFILRYPDIPHRYLLKVIRYIYCGKIDMSKLQSLDTLTLLNNVEVFNIKSLTSCIRDHLTKNQYEFLQ
jgi:hypothetical protein